MVNVHVIRSITPKKVCLCLEGNQPWLCLEGKLISFVSLDKEFMQTTGSFRKQIRNLRSVLLLLAKVLGVSVETDAGVT